MKKMLFSLMFTLGVALPAEAAYSFRQLWQDVANDTKRHFAEDLKTAYFYDFDADGAARSKFGVSATLLRYKFISADPVWLYTPSSSDQVGEIGFAFPIRLGDVPVGGGRNFRDVLIKKFGDSPDTGKWIDRLYFGPYMSHNFITERFGFGINAGVKFF